MLGHRLKLVLELSIMILRWHQPKRQLEEGKQILEALDELRCQFE